MFNFVEEAASVNIDSASNALHVSTPRWTFFVDSANWVLVVAD